MGVNLDGGLAQGLSVSAMKKRIGRLMTPRADGKLKVPQEMVDEWHKGNQDKLAAEFAQAGLDKDFSNCLACIHCLIQVVKFTACS